MGKLISLVFHVELILTYIHRLSAPRWTAAQRVLSLAHVSPRCRLSPVAHPRQMALHLLEPTTCPRRHQVPTLPARSPRINRASRVARVLRRSITCLLASLCQARLFRQECRSCATQLPFLICSNDYQTSWGILTVGKRDLIFDICCEFCFIVFC